MGPGLEVKIQGGAGRVTEDARNPGRCVQSQGPGPALAKGRNKVGLGSETWSVIELRREWGLVEKGSIVLCQEQLPSTIFGPHRHRVWPR